MWQTGSVNDYQDLLTALVNISTSDHVATVAVSAAGSGYAVNDVLTASGGTHTWTATFIVTSIGGGGSVTGIRISNGGAYTVHPSNSVATTTTGGGSSCTLTLTWAATGWSILRNTTPGGEKEVVLQGIGSGSDTIYVGIKTYNLVSSDTFTQAYNWTCVGMTGFNSGLAFESQAGVSPGAVPTSAGGSYVPLKTTDSFPILFWFNITGRRIIMFAKIENGSVTNYASCYLGFMNQFGTTTEFPYPILIAGSTSRHDCLWSTTAPSITGPTEVVGIGGRTGPMFFRQPNSTWQDVKNSIAQDSGSPSRATSNDYVCYPCGQSNISTQSVEDLITDNGGFTWTDIIPPSGIPGSASLKLQPTPNTGGDLRLLVPATVMESKSPDFDILGELDEVYWFSAVGGVASEDTLTVGSNVYRVFQNGNRTTEFSFCAVKEF